jgi:hypothetical protein
MTQAVKPLVPGESNLMSVASLLDHRFEIPAFQRPFDWGEEQVSDFVQDVLEVTGTTVPLFLGLVVLHPTEGGSVAVIDGQQRLTTVMLALAARGATDKVLPQVAGLQTPWIRPRDSDVTFIHALMAGRLESPRTLSQWQLKRAFDALASSKELKLDTLLSCEVIAYVAPSLAGATRLFERINLRGKEVCEFDLVKNKLIEWVAVEQDAATQGRLERFITNSYDKLYQMLDPKIDGDPFDSDKLLKTHWILFTKGQFRSGSRVLESLTHEFKGTPGARANVGKFIQEYLDSLRAVAEIWCWVERPYRVQNQYNSTLHEAILDFAKLGREGELQPLIISAILRFGDSAHKLVRFCEINSFRAALAKKNSNHGRSLKWRIANQLYTKRLMDALGKPVATVEGVIHQLFWLNTPYWSKSEALGFGEEFSAEAMAAEIVPDSAFESPEFFEQYQGLVRYFFWQYGKYLLLCQEWKDLVKVDVNPFQESVWFDAKKFRSWDIEHIYPRNPHDRETKDGKAFMREMSSWLNHLGNLTVLPLSDNRHMSNSVFRGKLEWMRNQAKVPFNELLDSVAYRGKMMNGEYWGPNNCRKRLTQLKAGADAIWGKQALEALGVQRLDARVKGYEPDDDDEG